MGLLNVPVRIFLFALALLLVYPQLIASIVGLVLFGIFCFGRWFSIKKAGKTPESQTSVGG